MAEDAVLDLAASEGYSSGVLHQLWLMRSEGEMTDLTIHTIDGCLIPCHANVMAAASKYVRQLLKDPLKNAQHREIELNFKEFELQRVVEYCYTGQISIQLSAASSYLRIAQYLYLGKLKGRIAEFVSANVSPQTCIGWYGIAKEFKLSTLGKTCRKIVASNIKQLADNAEFHLQEAQTVSDLMKSVKDADTALEACAAWATSNPLSRGEDFLHLVAQIQLAQCSAQCIEKVINSWKPVWPKYVEIQQALKPSTLKPSTLKPSTLKPSTLKPSASKLPRTQPKQTILIIGGAAENNEINRKMWKIDLSAESCELFHKMDPGINKYWSGYCVSPGNFFVVGGSRGMKKKTYTPLSDCHAFSIEDQQCIALPPTDEPTSAAALAYVNGSVYVFGGSPGATTVYRLDLLTNSWSSCPDMPEGNLFPIITAIGTTVYMIFNTNPSNEVHKTSDRATMYRFDTCALKWTKCRKLPDSLQDTCDASAVSVGTDLYLLGGQKRLCARYSDEHKTWAILEAPQLVHQSCSAVHIDGNIALFGGRDFDSDAPDKIEVYNIEQNTWKVHPVKMPVGLYCHYCAVYDEESGQFVTDQNS